MLGAGCWVPGEWDTFLSSVGKVWGWSWETGLESLERMAMFPYSEKKAPMGAVKEGISQYPNHPPQVFRFFLMYLRVTREKGARL